MQLTSKPLTMAGGWPHNLKCALWYFTRPELIALARELKLHIYANMTIPDLIDLITSSQYNSETIQVQFIITAKS